jgi:hypothetical protein
MIQGQYAPSFQPASFTPVDSVIPGYSAMMASRAAQTQSAAANRRQAQLAAIDAGIDASAQDELARRNEATAMRQNQNAMLNREGTRAGGGRYRRRGLFTPGGSGLDQANVAARTAARKKAAYTAFDADEAQKQEMEQKAAQKQFDNRFIGFRDGVLYL